MLDMKNQIIRFSLLVCTMALASCGEMDEIHRDFYAGGEIIYPGKADSLRAYPGRYRLGLSWMVLADPKSTRAKIYWNNRQDSMDVNMARSGGTDVFEVMFNDLEEKAYTFEVYTYDNEGNQSVRSEVLGIVYGDIYEQTLLNRAVRSISVVKGKPVIEWMAAEEGVVGDQIRYVDSKGFTRELFAPASADSTWLPDFMPDAVFEARTLFLPDSLAIDTFRTAYRETQIDSSLFVRPQLELDKGLFQLVKLPTDTYQPYSSANNSVDKIWDGKLNTESPTFLTAPGTPMPQWFTFDLGVTVQLTKMKLYQRGTNTTRLYAGGNVKTFEIWGSTDPNPDGSWDDSWILLGSFESVKPSGSPAGQMTSEDLNYILAGEDFQFASDVPEVRYIRFKTLSNWDAAGRDYANIGEVTFWTNED